MRERVTISSQELEHLQRKDEQAWAGFVTKLTPSLKRRAHSIVGQQDAEDVVQSTFMEIFERIDTLKLPVIPYVYRTLYTKGINRIRHKKRGPEELVSTEEAGGIEIFRDAKTDVSEQVVEEIVGSDLVNKLQSSIHKKQIDAFLLQVEGYSQGEIAQLQDTTTNTVGVRILRGKEKSRKVLEGTRR